MTATKLSIILTQNIVTSEGKVTKATRKINNLKPSANKADIQVFAETIEALTGENYDTIEIVKTEAINE
ncbi:DUF1659 domain-containing protein [Staphylococcus sp. 17KM0847]|uniref:DUF1659 domain-containing protein n=1 Tax=Staphylococcus sp. 17KM0847 TaxID=2583989 RepID=UPI0015DBE404|nr:DUF1659 domain-containing protein [Staphylococcus sp. 17KM0847]QLK85415.1 DUF1659 domain-containing protein [Staphylococcus sp. 17KM0847]